MLSVRLINRNLDIIAKTGAPSASIAVVKGGKLAYATHMEWRMWRRHQPANDGDALQHRLHHKQFTAATVLLLVERRKIIARRQSRPLATEATRAAEFTVRELLSMTSGCQDFWPQNYVMPNMMQPTSAREISGRLGRQAARI